MTIIKRKLKQSFAPIDTRVLNNPNLSFKAKGLYAYIAALPPDWTLREKDLANRSTDSLHSVRSGIQELIDAGFIVRERVHDDKGRIHWETTFYEMLEDRPSHLPKCDYPNSVFPNSENHMYSNNTGTNNTLNSADAIPPKPKQEKKAIRIDGVINHLANKIGVVPNDKVELIAKFGSHCSEEVLYFLADVIAENPRKPSHIYEKKIAAWCRHSPEQNIEKIKAFELAFNQPKKAVSVVTEYDDDFFKS